MIIPVCLWVPLVQYPIVWFGTYIYIYIHKCSIYCYWWHSLIMMQNASQMSPYFNQSQFTIETGCFYVEKKFHFVIYNYIFWWWRNSNLLLHWVSFLIWYYILQGKSIRIVQNLQEDEKKLQTRIHDLQKEKQKEANRISNIQKKVKSIAKAEKKNKQKVNQVIKKGMKKKVVVLKPKINPKQTEVSTDCLRCLLIVFFCINNLPKMLPFSFNTWFYLLVIEI